MPPKPTNPTTKDLEDAIQGAQARFDEILQNQSIDLDHRFQQITKTNESQMGLLYTRLDNQASLQDTRFETLSAQINTLIAQQQTAATTNSQTPPTTRTSSGITLLPASPPGYENIITSGQNTPSGSPGTPIFQPYITQSIPLSFATVITNPPTPPSPIFTSSTRLTAQQVPLPPPIPPLPPPYYPNPTFYVQSTPAQPMPSSFPFYPSFTHPPPTPNSPFLPFTPTSPIYPQNTPNPPLRSPKLDLLPFDGTDPLEWLFQADQFFCFYHIPIESRLHMSAFYMKGDALSWFKWMYQNNQLHDWTSFTKALELRFGPSSYTNHHAELFKLKQDGSVSAYQAQFEKLGNRVLGLPTDAILNCFISGLTPDIRNEIAIQKPHSISQAIGLAKLIEAKLKDSRPKYNRPFGPPNHNNSPRSTFPPKNSRIPPNTPSNTIKNPNTTNPTKIPIRRLTEAQMQERRALGLCYNYDEKFIAGHKCGTSKFFLLLVDEDTIEATLDTIIPTDEEEPTTEQIEANEQIDIYFQLSPHAVSGHFSPQTLKFRGYINGLPVMVLVDTGSTHNILQPRIATHLQLPTTPITQFSVMVGNGSHIRCTGIYNDVSITLQNTMFNLPFYLIPIQGADVVLGMEWLRTLGPLQADFSIPSITFLHQNTTITLQGDSNNHPTPTTFHQLCHLLHTDSIASLHLLTFHPTSPIPNPTKTTAQPLSFDPNIPTAVTKILHKYPQIFQDPHGLPPSRPHDHRIPLLPNTPPINVKPYRYPHSQKEAMTTIINDMLRQGTIVPSTSPFSSPVLLVRKKDGTWRFCVDYRALNAVTIKDRFPIPTIDELLDELGEATIFTKIDLRSGYHQIRVASEDTHKTAFRTFDGHYEFLVMPFGLSNAPSTFQSAMNDFLHPYLRRFVLVFFDDILIFSRCLTDHLLHLKLVLDLLQLHNYVAKLSKCVFAVSKVNYLGHVISAQGVTPDPEKIQAILDWPEPRSLTALRGFLGLTGFYRRFLRHYATLAAPLTDLLRSTNFVWNTAASSAFTELKNKITSVPVLTLPDFSQVFVVETDASAVAIGAVLSQGGHPLAFFSKKMCPRLQASSTYVREMYAITEAVKKWRQYLIGRQFYIFTDQQSLKNLLAQTIQTPEQQKWAFKLQGFNFKIFYKPGKSNIVADALSRKFSEDIEGQALFAISSPVPSLITQLKDFYATSKEGKELVHKTQTDDHMKTLYRFSHGLLYFKEKLFVPNIADLRRILLQEYHITPSAGHSSLKPTLARTSAAFTWPGIHADTKRFVQHCTTCQHNKYLPQKQKGLLQSLPPPNQVWEELTMDFITHLPQSFGHTAIWVICDRLTKFVHFIGLPTKYTATDLAHRFS